MVEEQDKKLNSVDDHGVFGSTDGDGEANCGKDADKAAFPVIADDAGEKPSSHVNDNNASEGDQSNAEDITKCSSCAIYSSLLCEASAQKEAYVSKQQALTEELVVFKTMVNDLRSELERINSRQDIEKERTYINLVTQVTTVFVEAHNHMIIAFKNFDNDKVSKHVSEEIEPYRSVLKMVMDSISVVLDRFCVEVIYPNEGDEFDIDRHSVVATESVTDNNAHLNGKVVKVVSSGYMLYHNGTTRLIKPASVIVLK